MFFPRILSRETKDGKHKLLLLRLQQHQKVSRSFSPLLLMSKATVLPRPTWHQNFGHGDAAPARRSYQTGTGLSGSGWTPARWKCESPIRAFAVLGWFRLSCDQNTLCPQEHAPMSWGPEMCLGLFWDVRVCPGLHGDMGMRVSRQMGYVTSRQQQHKLQRIFLLQMFPTYLSKAQVKKQIALLSSWTEPQTV